MIRIAAVIFMSLIAMASQAQNGSIKGTIVDRTDQSQVSGATVSLLLQRDSSLVKNVVSDSSGQFAFNDIPNDSFIVTVNTLTYQQYVSFITIRDNQRNLGTIGLDRKGKDLSVVTIVAKVAPVTHKGDTAQYSASQFKVNPDAN